MIRCIVIFLLFFSVCCYSQTEKKQTIYLNADLEQIDQLTYSEKLLKSIYRESIITHDSLVVKSLIKTYDFGHFNETELFQVQNLFKKFFDVNDFNKNIILAFKDSILGYPQYSMAIQHKRNIDQSDVISEDEYKRRRRNYDSRQKKCKKFASKNNFLPIYTYSANMDFVFKPKHHTKHKIPDVIRHLFFKNVKKGHIILKPNGQYFYYSFITQKQVKKMLEEDWSHYIEEFNNVKSDSNKYSLKFIDKMYEDFENDMRTIAIQRLKHLQKERTNSRNHSSPPLGRINPPYCFTYAGY